MTLYVRRHKRRFSMVRKLWLLLLNSFHDQLDILFQMFGVKMSLMFLFVLIFLTPRAIVKEKKQNTGGVTGLFFIFCPPVSCPGLFIRFLKFSSYCT